MPHLSAFVGGRPIVSAGAAQVAAVAGWSGQRSGRRARRIAGSALPCLLFEDGFIRSVGLGKTGAATVSVVVDQAAHHDARGGTRLEALLNAPSDFYASSREAAVRGLAAWRMHRLSKYNTGVDVAPDALRAARPLVLVDQLKGDRSVDGACASAADFIRMLDLALAHRPTREILIRTHPDVVSGFGRGYLTDVARRRGIGFVDPSLSSHAVLDFADEIWTVSSGLGFEAILRQVPVRVFGAPFYAGWGLTEDRGGEEAAACLRRRTSHRSVEEMFAATFLHAARYADPVSRRPLTFEGAVDRLTDWKARDRAHSGGATVCYGFSPWKRRSAATFLGGSASTVEFVRKRPAMFRRAAHPSRSRVAVWGAEAPPTCVKRGSGANLPLVRVEDGFLRSVGLGSSLRPAGSLVIDDIGLYYDARRPSRLEMLLEGGAFTPELLARARHLQDLITANHLTKYNLAGANPGLRGRANGRSILLVVEQVPTDLSLRYGGGDVASALHLASHLKARFPESFLVYKEHPDLVVGNRWGRQSRAKLDDVADLVVSTGDVGALLDDIDDLHTISSLAGFEALVRGKRVHTWGRPFYAGWGLTQDALRFERRTRRASLDELMAAALILYPSYVEPLTGTPCSVEEYVESLLFLRDADPTARGPEYASQLRRLFRFLGASVRAPGLLTPRHF